MIRRSTDFLVVHTSATPPTMDIGAAEIRQWHKAKGWADIGYHFVIRRNGAVELGRPENQIGSHVAGRNSNSLGICMVGGVDARQRPANNYTAEQWASLQTLLMRLTGKYPGARIIGHRDFPGVAKACPCFDAIKWAQDLQLPAAPRMRIVTAAMVKAIKVEREEGDEADPEEIAAEAGADPTTAGQWMTALTPNVPVSGYGVLSGADWIGILIMCVTVTIIVFGALIWMGNENRQKLWRRIVG